MSRQVVLIGHCGADSSYLRLAVKAANPTVKIVAAESDASLTAALADEPSLVLVNRVVDYGFKSDEGVEIIREAKAAYPDARFMLVSNYEEAQAAATAAGAAPGFGKREIGTPRVKDLLKAALAESAIIVK